MPEVEFPHVAVDGRLQSADGTELYWRGWLPEGSPRGVLVFVHGLAEHSGRYLNPVAHFVPLGYACYAVDLRGHGHSGGLRVHVDSFDDYLDDVSALLAEVRRRHPHPPALVGHSMGGLVALLFALGRGDAVAAAVASSPGLAAHPSARPSLALRIAARVLSVLIPRVLISSDLDPRAISRDPEVVRDYLEDPQVSSKASPRWYTSFLAAQRRAFKGAPSLGIPTLVMQSGDDRLVDPAAAARWAEAAPRDLVTYIEWPGLFHEMFNEPERRRVFEAMEPWLDRHLSGGP